MALKVKGQVRDLWKPRDRVESASTTHLSMWVFAMLIVFVIHWNVELKGLIKKVMRV